MRTKLSWAIAAENMQRRGFGSGGRRKCCSSEGNHIRDIGKKINPIRELDTCIDAINSIAASTLRIEHVIESLTTLDSVLQVRLERST